MTTTKVATTDNRNVLRAQEDRIAVEMIRRNPYEGLEGEGNDQPIKVVTDLKKGRGETIRVFFGAKLQDDGTDDDQTLEGNEEAERDFSQDIKLGQKRKGIRLDGELSEQRSAVELRSRAGDLLSAWPADLTAEYITYYLSGARGVRSGNLITPLTWSGFAGNALIAPDANHWLIADSANPTPAIAQLQPSAIMKTSVLETLKRRISLLVNIGPPMEPLNYKGKKLFIAYLTPEQMFDLRQDPRWQEAQQWANMPGDDNPIFSGAEGMWGGFVIKEISCGVLFNNYGGAGNLPAARGFVVGAKALGKVQGKTRSQKSAKGALDNRWWFREKDFDYENKAGFATGDIFGYQKLSTSMGPGGTQWDYGVYTFDTAYTVA